MGPRHAWVAAAAATLFAALPGGADAAGPFTTCPAGKQYQCAIVNAPLDPTGGTPGTVRLAVTRLLARDTPAATTAVIGLAGGPGQAALPLTEDFADVLKPALGSRDFLVFDQRGTGLSHPLSCKALDSDPSKSLSATVRRCAQEIGPARGFFTTAQSVSDIEAIRVAGGYSKLTLFGVSYGTKVAEAYAAAHPDHVEALVLDSVVTPDGPDALSRSSLQAVPRVIGQDLCGSSACKSVSRDPVKDIRTLAARLAKKPIKGPVYSPSGRRYTASLSAAGVVSILLAGDLNPTLRAELPGALRAALTGDTKPILRLSVRSSGLANQARFQAFEADNDPLYFDTTCEETTSIPWTRGAAQKQRSAELKAAIAALPAGATGIFPRSVASAGIPDLCLGWLVASPPPVPDPALPNVPALIIDGQSDLRTPVEDAASVAAKLPRATLVSVPHSGHSVLGSEPGTCAQSAIAAFFALTPVAACPRIRNPYGPTPRPPLTLKQVGGAKGYPATVGRTLNALLDTLADGNRQIIGEALAIGDTPVGAGGLRAGAVRVGKGDRLVYQGYEYVPGVKISGTDHPSGTSSFTITGASAARGKVTISKRGTLTGRLGSSSVRSSLVSARSARTRRSSGALPTLREAVARGRLIAAGA